MSNCKPSPTPFQSDVKLSVECITPLVDATLYRQLVGNLIYLTHNMPNISFVVSTVSKFMQQPHESHWREAKIIMRYLKGIVNYGVFYLSSATVSLLGYTNSDSIGDSSNIWSTANYLFQLGSGSISWSIRWRLLHYLLVKQSIEKPKKQCGYAMSLQNLDYSEIYHRVEMWQSRCNTTCSYTGLSFQDKTSWSWCTLYPWSSCRWHYLLGILSYWAARSQFLHQIHDRGKVFPSFLFLEDGGSCHQGGALVMPPSIITL